MIPPNQTLQGSRGFLNAGLTLFFLLVRKILEQTNWYPAKGNFFLQCLYAKLAISPRSRYQILLPHARNMERLVASHLKGNQVRSTLQVGVWPAWSHGEPCGFIWQHGERHQPRVLFEVSVNGQIYLSTCLQRIPKDFARFGSDRGHPDPQWTSCPSESEPFPPCAKRPSAQCPKTPIFLQKKAGLYPKCYVMVVVTDQHFFDA